MKLYLGDHGFETLELEAMTTFAAERSGRLESFVDDIRPIVADALTLYGQRLWYAELVDAASVLWLEAFERESGEPGRAGALETFRTELAKTLKKTTQPDDPPADAQINRLADWIGVYALNSGTYFAQRAEGLDQKRWLTMEDDDVRASHRAVAGQTIDIGATFDVGGSQLHFPGEPVGDLGAWINCRCWLYRTGGEMTNAITAAAVAEDEEYLLDDPEETAEAKDFDEGDLVDDVEEIPIHGVATVEGTPTGDGRMFATGALSHRELPLPIRFEYVGSHGGNDTSMVATVGRIDEMWLEGSEYRYRGALIMSAEHTPTVVEGIIDGRYRGVSVEVDDIVVDVSEQREQMKEQLLEERNRLKKANQESDEVDVEQQPILSDEEIEEMVERFIGDGTAQITAFTKARVDGFTIVPIGAFAEAYIALGHEFEEELSDEDREAIAACACGDSLLAPEPEDDGDYRTISAEDRKKLAKSGKAMPDGSYPIENVEDLKNAIQSIGRAKNPGKAKAHIKKRAKALGKSDLIPDDWAAETVSFAPGTKDGPGWITHPRATARIRRYWVHGKGAAKIGWGRPGDFNRCRRLLAKYVQNPEWLAGLCANMHKEATGTWPGRQRGDKHAVDVEGAAPAMVITAAATPAFRPPREWFENPQLERPTPLTVDGGRVFGHLAEWNACLLNGSNLCVAPPHSASDYAHFRTGALETDDGDVAVGPLTMRVGHAPIPARPTDVVKHYDNSDAVFADVAIGEDEHGIWYSGAFRQHIDEDTRREIKATARMSGDWRPMAGKLDLLGAVLVANPGYSTPRAIAASAAGHQTALLGAGVVEPTQAILASGIITVDHLVGAIEAGVDRVLAHHALEAAAPVISELDAELAARDEVKLAEARAILEEA